MIGLCLRGTKGHRLCLGGTKGLVCVSEEPKGMVCVLGGPKGMVCLSGTKWYVLTFHSVHLSEFVRTFCFV